MRGTDGYDREGAEGGIIPDSVCEAPKDVGAPSTPNTRHPHTRHDTRFSSTRQVRTGCLGSRSKRGDRISGTSRPSSHLT